MFIILLAFILSVNYSLSVIFSHYNHDCSKIVPNTKNLFIASPFEKEVQSPIAINTTTIPFSRGLGYCIGNWCFATYAFADIIFDHQFLRKKHLKNSAHLTILNSYNVNCFEQNFEFHNNYNQHEHKIFSTNNFLFLIKHTMPKSRFNLRTILSLEPQSIGKYGYPLLFSKGGTSDHVTLLVNRFPAHDIVNEISFDYSYYYADLKYYFLYLALPGAAALGPLPTQRIAAFYIPEAPITYHFLDSTQVSYGVINFGFRHNFLQLEASIFNGKFSESDHWHFKKPDLNSFSSRLSFYFCENFIAQCSFGHIKQPYEFEPDVNIDRITTSISYNQNWDENNFFQAIFAWGKNINNPGYSNDGFLFETCLNIKEKHIFNTRIESIDMQYLSNQNTRVNKLGLSYLYYFDTIFHIRSSLGASINLGFVPDKLNNYYKHPFNYFLFLKFELA